MTIAPTPAAPYFIVTFTSQRRPDDDGYGEMADRMDALARQQPGFLGAESARGPDGFGITNTYWADEYSIRAWKRHVDHIEAQKRGRSDWYQAYCVRVGRIERAYDFTFTP